MRGSFIHRTFGRQAFGRDPASYDATRPPYPEWVFDFLRERCGLGPDTVTSRLDPGRGRQLVNC